MIKLIYRTRNFFSKDIVIIIIISLLNLSFIRYDWENDTKSRVKIHEKISTIFKSKTYTIDSISDNFYNIIESEKILVKKGLLKSGHPYPFCLSLLL